MDAEPQASAHEPVDQRRVRMCGVAWLEAIVSFTVPAIALVFGTLFLPGFIIRIVSHPHERLGWELVIRVLLGWAGLASLARVLWLLSGPFRQDQWARLTLMGIGCGVAGPVYHWYAVATGQAPDSDVVLTMFVYLPLACTAHLLYLARYALFGRDTPPS